MAQVTQAAVSKKVAAMREAEAAEYDEHKARMDTSESAVETKVGRAGKAGKAGRELPRRRRVVAAGRVERRAGKAAPRHPRQRLGEGRAGRRGAAKAGHLRRRPGARRRGGQRRRRRPTRRTSLQERSTC